MGHMFHIGAVKEITADELRTTSILIYKGVPTNIAAITRTPTRVKVRFSGLSGNNHWDLSLTKASVVYILGAKRVTGMKERTL